MSRWGCGEYWQYDPTGDYLEPPLRCLSLVRGEYEELTETRLGDGSLVMYSAVLGLEVRVEEGGLRFRDPETGESISTFTELRQGRQQARQQAELARQQAEQAQRQAEDARRAAEARLEREVAARQAAAAQVAELQALLARRPEPGADSGPGG